MIKNYNIKLSAALIMRLLDYLCKTLVDVATVDFTCDNARIEIWTLNKM